VTVHRVMGLLLLQQPSFGIVCHSTDFSVNVTSLQMLSKDICLLIIIYVIFHYVQVLHSNTHAIVNNQILFCYSSSLGRCHKATGVVEVKCRRLYS